MGLPVTPAIPNTEGVTPSATPSLETATPIVETATTTTSPDTTVQTDLSSKTVITPLSEVAPVEDPVTDPVVPLAEAAPVEDIADVDTGYDLELSEESPLSQEDLDTIAQYAADNDLNVEQANAIIASQEALINKGVEAQTASQNAIHIAAAEAFNADPDFIGDKRIESFAAIHRVTSSFGDADLTVALSDPHIGSSLPLAKFLVKLGNAMVDDTPVGKGAAPKKVAPVGESAQLQTMYPAFYKKD